jgi:hypothetical protein
VSILFAAFLGYNPIQHLLGSSVLSQLPAHTQAVLSGRTFFPELIQGPFRNGLHEAFAFAVIACLIAAVASWSRGERYVDGDAPVGAPKGATAGAAATPVAAAAKTAAT